MTKNYLTTFNRKSGILNSTFILCLFLLMCNCSKLVAQTNSNPFGFEDGALLGWTVGSSTESVLINNVAANARTGTYSLNLSTTVTGSNKYWYTNSVYGASASGTYVHFIYWIKTSTAGTAMDASMRYASAGPPSGTGSTANGTAVTIPADTWTRVTYFAGNSNNRWYFPAPRRTSGGIASFFMDDGIIYTSASNTTDLTAPLTPTGLTATAAGANANLSWTSNTDAGTGVQATIILRTTNTAAPLPVLNDQGVYSTLGGADGPSAIGDWTVISTTTGATATAYTDNGVANGTYKYAVLLRDLAYNYSAAAVSSPVTIGSSATPVITADQTGFNGAFGNVVMGTNSISRQFLVSGTNLTGNVTVTAPAGFQVSTAAATGFAATATLSPVSGTVAATPIYARYAPAAATGASGNVDIAITATGATAQQVTVSGNALSTEPTTAGTITFGTIGANSIVVNLPTVGNGTRRIIVAKQGIAPTFTPTDGVALSGVNANYTTATDQGGINKVVYDGAGSGNGVVTVTGLTLGTLYFFTVIEYNVGTGTSHNYLLTPSVTASTSTTGLPSPVITVNQTGFTGTFGNVVTGTNSANQQYTVTGANLTADIVLTAPAGFSISTTAAAGFASTLTLTPTSGAVAATTIYVRYSPTAASGATGNLTISHTSTGAVTQQVTVSGNALSVEPSAAGTISFGTTTLNSIVLNLPTVGNGSSRIIVARAVSAVTFIPADGVAVTGVNANFTTATDQGTGNRIVYEGTGSGNGVVTVSGLTPATAYYFTVYEYNRGTGTSYNYLATPVATGNTATQTPPAVIVADATGLNGNFGNVVMGTNVAGRQYSVSASGLTAGLLITAPAGFQVSTSAAAGFGTSLTLSPSAGAIPVTSIYVRYVPTAATGATGNVNITHTSTGAPSQDVAVSGNALATQPTSIGTIGFGTLNSNSIVVNLPTVGNGNKRIIVVKQGAAPAFVPTDGIAVTGVNSNFSTATDQGAGERVVYDGAASGSSVVLVSGLTPNTAYYFTVFEYNAGSGTSQNYLTAPVASGNTTTLNLVPNVVVTTTGFSGNFGNVVRGTQSAVQQYTISGTGLSNDITITAPAQFEVSLNATTGFAASLVVAHTGGTIAATAIYVRYVPTAADGATGNRVIFHTSIGATTRNLTVTGNAVDVEPVSIGSITFSDVTDTTMEVNLPTIGDGARRIIITNLGSPAAFVPADGAGVTGINANYPLALTQAGSGKIIYDGTGSGANVVKLTGLTPGMLYYFTVYEYNLGTGTSHNYLVNRAANSNMTTSVYVPNSVGNNPIAKQIKIFPNPVKNIIYAEAPIAVHITITDAMGRMMARLMNAKQADMSAFPAGYYQVLITDTTGKLLKTEKVLKAE